MQSEVFHRACTGEAVGARPARKRQRVVTEGTETELDAKEAARRAILAANQYIMQRAWGGTKSLRQLAAQFKCSSYVSVHRQAQEFEKDTTIIANLVEADNKGNVSNTIEIPLPSSCMLMQEHKFVFANKKKGLLGF